MSKEKTMQDISKQYFSADNLEAGSNAVNEAVELVAKENGMQQFNFDPNADFPAGYGLAIIPINQRNEATGSTDTIGVSIAAIPDFNLLDSSEAGKEYIRDTVQAALMAKLANAVRPRKDATAPASIPFTVEDFITSNRAEGVLVAFRKLAGAYVKVLKNGGLKLMTPDILRQVFQSSAFAGQQFPKVPQENWVRLLDSMIAKATEQGMAVGMLAEWKATRDTAGLPEVDEIDLSDMDFSSI